MEEVVGKKPSVVIASYRRQKLQVVIAKSKRFEILNGFLEPCSDGVAAFERILPEVEMENRLVVIFSGLPIAVGHGELVEIGQQPRGKSHEGEGYRVRRGQVFPSYNSPFRREVR